MIEINGALVSEDILEEKFVCNLNACKGACCWEGDYGAPVTKKEMADFTTNIDSYKDFLSEDSISFLESNTGFEYYEEAQQWGTSCHQDGACVFMNKNELGIAYCGIEKAHKQDPNLPNKPISCHLYPIRITQNEHLGFEAWNYDEWDICNAACSLGKELKVPVFKFLRDSIIRHRGEDFYEQLEAAADYLAENK